MVKLPSYATLLGVAGGCGMGVGVMMLLLTRETEKFANNATFIKRAVDIMREEPTVRQLLGDKIEVGKATFTDGWSKLRTTQVQVRVPIKGEHDNAYLFAYARKKDEKEKLKLFKIEASFDKIANKKLVILDRTDQEDEEEPVSEPPPKATSQPPEDKGRPKLTKEDYKQQMKSWAHR